MKKKTTTKINKNGKCRYIDFEWVGILYIFTVNFRFVNAVTNTLSNWCRNDVYDIPFVHRPQYFECHAIFPIDDAALASLRNSRNNTATTQRNPKTNGVWELNRMDELLFLPFCLLMKMIRTPHNINSPVCLLKTLANTLINGWQSCHLVAPSTQRDT